MKWNYLVTLDKAPSFNMALDEYLMLKAGKSGNCKPLLRFYSWEPPAISIGYNQKSEMFDLKKILDAGIEFVRRITGGRAVLHHRELTYSIIAKSNDPVLGRTITETYKAVGRAFVHGLKLAGIDCAMEKSTGGPGRRARDAAPPCFASTARYEVVAGGKKLLGSAQKRTKNFVLQHGSLLLDYPEKSVADYLNLNAVQKKEYDRQERENAVTLKECGRVYEHTTDLACLLKKGFEESLGLEFTEYSLNKTDLHGIKELEENRYNTNKWNLKI
jgi:lipoate-protein ligase A